MVSYRNFSEGSDKVKFNVTTQLYSSLSRTLRQLIGGIKLCLEFVSTFILYLLGMNHHIFSYSASGDGADASFQFNEAQFLKQTQRSKSCSDCLRTSASFYNVESEIKRSGSFSGGTMQKEKDDVSGIATSSAEETRGESGNEADTSDAETPCCFAVRRLKRLVKRQSKDKDKSYKNYRKRHLAKHESDSSDQIGKSRQQHSLKLSGRKPVTQNSPSPRKSSIEEMSEKGSLQLISPAVDGEQQIIEQDVTLDCISTIKDVLGNAMEQPTETGAKMSKAEMERNKTNEKPVLRSPKSVFTKTNSPVHATPVSVSDFSARKPADTDSLLNNTYLREETTEDRRASLASTEEQFESMNEDMSSKPLEIWEEKYLREVFNQEPGEERKTKKYSTLENVKRIYCITSQALRQRIGDKLYYEMIHACRRSIKTFILHRDDKSSSQYFKTVVGFYNQFKKCAVERKHEISRFILNAKNEEECKYLINTDKTMAWTKRRLDPTDQTEGQLTAIRSLFQESSAFVTENSDVDTKEDKEPFVIEENEESPQFKISDPAAAQAEVQSYLTKLCGETKGANASFRSAIGALSEHFTQLFTSTQAPEETTVNQNIKSKSPETTKRSANFEIVHYGSTKSSVVSPEVCKKLISYENKTQGKHAIAEQAPSIDLQFMSPRGFFKKETKVKMSSEIQAQQTTKPESEEKSSHGEKAYTPMSVKAQDTEYTITAKAVEANINKNEPHSKDVDKVIETKHWQDFEVKKTSSKRNCIDEATDKDTDDWKRAKIDEPTPELSISDKGLEECRAKETQNDGTDVRNSLRVDAPGTEEILTREEEKNIGTTEKKIPPPVPKKPTKIKTVDDIVDMCKVLRTETRLHKTLANVRQPPPVPKKPDFRLRQAVSPPEEFPCFRSPQYGENDPSFSPRRDENNSFSPEKRSLFMPDGNTDGFGNNQRILQDIASASQHQQEIVIQNSTGYEVIFNHGRASFIPNILDFEFEHRRIMNELIENETRFAQEGWQNSQESDLRPKPPVEKEQEKYEEHFEIDRSVYDQSGCKILPGSCTKVNRRLLEMKDKKKKKTKGVANKHLLKAFNDVDHSQNHNSEETDDGLVYLDEMDRIDDDVEDKYKSETDEEKEGSDESNEADQANDTVNINYVEDVRHWEMLPTEVRRKNEDEEIDDKYYMATKATPDEKKKGKKKKDKRQKAQPMSLKELSFQFGK